MRIIILAAGVGSRLGRSIPKPLTELADGESIVARQLRLLRDHFESPEISIVVGYKKEMIMEAHPDVSFVYNHRFGDTNTSKSLLVALKQSGNGGVLWMNGDVVFDETMLPVAHGAIDRDVSFVAVNKESVGDEEVKYRLDAHASITELSKTVVDGEGEAVGINFVAAHDKSALIAGLSECHDDDYFERGIELAIGQASARFEALDVAGLCIEVDFEADLDNVNRALGSQ